MPKPSEIDDRLKRIIKRHATNIRFSTDAIDFGGKTLALYDDLRDYVHDLIKLTVMETRNESRDQS